jgi:GTP cyclohydrolase II
MIDPSQSDLVARGRTDLRLGVPVVIGDTLIASAETLSDARLAGLRDLGTSLGLAITHWRAATLKIAAYDGEFARLELPNASSGEWIRAIADPALDLRHPMKGPLRPMRDSAPAELQDALALTKSAHLLPAVVFLALSEGVEFARSHGLTWIDPATLAASLQNDALHPVARANVPLAAASAGRVHVFRPETGGAEHYAIEIGSPDRAKPVLTRLHSACFTGDVLGSLKCDCGAQLSTALHQMGAEGHGVLLYLQQEGRGIGLANKMRAYALQDQGFDTVEANHRLGFEDDERNFRIGARILRELGFSKIRLMTNNPEKQQTMTENGMEVVERVPLQVGERAENIDYLRTKARKSGHLL